MFSNRNLAIGGGGALLVVLLLVLIFGGDDAEDERASEQTATVEAVAEPETEGTAEEAEPAAETETAAVEEEPAVETVEPEVTEAPAAEEPDAAEAQTEEPAPADTAEPDVGDEAANAEPEPATAEEATAEASAEAATEPEAEAAQEPASEEEPAAETRPEGEIQTTTEVAEAASEPATEEDPAAVSEPEAGSETVAEAEGEPVVKAEPAAPAEPTAEAMLSEQPASESADASTPEPEAAAAAPATIGGDPASDDSGTELAAASDQPAEDAAAEAEADSGSTEPTAAAEPALEPQESAAAPATEPDTVETKMSAADPTSLQIGQGRSYANGTVRLFLSRLDPDGQRALVAINGTERTWLAAGESTEAEGTGCTLTLGSIEQTTARIDVNCSDSATAEPVTEVAATTDGAGLRAGQTAVLADGAVRAFLGQVDAEGGRARVAVNGYERTWLEVGKATQIAGTDCSVVLDGIEDGGARLSADCGGSAQASGDAAQASGAIATGQVASLAGGKLRVFLSGLDTKGERARVAVNGYKPRWVHRGKHATIRGTGCRLTLDGIEARTAAFSADCTERAEPEPGTAATLAAGQTGSFAEGTARLFLSRVDAGAEQVRVAVNGMRPLLLTLGEPRDVEGTGCEAELLGIEGRQATIAMNCAAEQVAAAGDTASDAGGGMLRAGQTRVADGGALRIFVSAVDAQNDRARLAINGQERVWVGRGDAIEAGEGCTVSVDQIEGRAVRLTADCG